MSDRILYEYRTATGQKIVLIQGDLTRQDVDAVVNAANERLLHGGGVAAVIAQRGGRQVNIESREWVRQHGPVSHEQPAYTTGGDLPCKYIIHAVGPVWGSGNEDEKLAAAITGSLQTAEELGLSSIAFPAISTGIFGFPKKRAARIFYETFLEYLQEFPDSKLNDIRMVVYDHPTTQAFTAAWQEVFEA